MTFQQAQWIIERMCWTTGIPLELLLSGRRTASVARLRGEIAVELRRLTELSWSEIASLIGRKSSIRTRDYPKRK